MTAAPRPRPPGIPDELLEIAYVFSGLDRVLGLQGRLRAAGAAELELDDLLIACTHVSRGDGAAAEALVRRGLAECGWIADAGPDGAAWRAGAFRLRVDRRRWDAGHLYTALLCLGDGQRHVPAYLDRDLPRHVRALQAAPRRAPPRPTPPRCDPDDAAAALARGGVIAYTGAGVSVESGIPAFVGAGSLDERVGLYEPFPGEVVARMLACPEALAGEIRDFQARLAMARPGLAHRLLASLERTGVIACVVTTNIDMLHELAGSRAVRSPAQLGDAALAAADALLVLGVSRDDDGVIARARAAGLRVIAADPEPPEYLADGDWYVQADAATLLRAIVALAAAGTFATYAGPPLPAAERRTMRETIPDLGALLARVHGLSTSRTSTVHGESHWRDTAWLGAGMVRAEPACDPALVFLFALLHDCRRLHDGHDPDHGDRSAALVGELRGELLRLSDARAEVLRAACAEHSCGLVTAHPTIGACWDADRLGLWRIGVAPAPAGLSLARNRSAERIERAGRELGTPLEWPALFELYERAG